MQNLLTYEGNLGWNFGDLSSERLAIFTLSGNIIRSDRGNKIIYGPHDWVWYSDTVPSWIDQLAEDGWSIVFFETVKTIKDAPIVESRINSLRSNLKSNPSIFVVFSPDRKHGNPLTTAWTKLLSGINFKPNDESFLCTHRLGPNSQKPLYRSKDNKDIAFVSLSKLQLVSPDDILPTQPPPTFPYPNELIITVGQQESGRREYTENVLKKQLGYIVIHRKEYKHGNIIENHLREGKKVVFNATNPTRANRRALVNIATKIGVPVRIFWFTQSGQNINKITKKYPGIALTIYSSRFERPVSNEASLVRIN